MTKKIHLMPDTCPDVPTCFNLAAEAECTDILVIGWGKDGDFYATWSKMDRPNLLYLLELTKEWVMK